MFRLEGSGVRPAPPYPAQAGSGTGARGNGPSAERTPGRLTVDPRHPHRDDAAPILRTPADSGASFGEHDARTLSPLAVRPIRTASNFVTHPDCGCRRDTLHWTRGTRRATNQMDPAATRRRHEVLRPALHLGRPMQSQGDLECPRKGQRRRQLVGGVRGTPGCVTDLECDAAGALARGSGGPFGLR